MWKVKIGLALGAGAAKGWAHIGVINALRKLGIEADIVAGCSVGALVGAAFASHRLPINGAMGSFIQLLGRDQADGSVFATGGLLRGERVFNAGGQLLKIDDFADCSLKFGAVMTNLSTDRELWMTKGDIHQAIRASCSMLGLLAPVWYEGYWLVDGALVNPVPISLTRAMGADIVIAVDLQHDAHLIQQDLFSVHSDTSEAHEAHNADASNWRRERLRERINRMTLKKTNFTPTAMEIMTTSIQMLENRVKRTRMASDPPDLLIRPYFYLPANIDAGLPSRQRSDRGGKAGGRKTDRYLDSIDKK